MKSILLLIALFIGTMHLSAQPVIGQQAVIGSTGDDEITACTIRTKDGGFMVGGYSNGPVNGNKTAVNYGSWDYWIVKYDKLGRKQWDKTYGGDNYEILGSVIQTKDGGYLLGGSSVSNISGVKSENSRGNQDMWVVKIDSKGNIQWDKTYGGNDYDDLASVIETADGNYLLAGGSYSNISGEKTTNSFGSGDYWVIKIDTSGSILWQKIYGGTRYDDATKIAQTSTGGYMIAGRSASGRNGNKSTTAHGADDVWLVKTDSSGNIILDRTIGGNATDFINTMDVTTDGNFILGAFSNSAISGNKTEASRGGYDYWVVKVNQSGTVLWDKTIGGSLNDEATGIKTTTDGGYIIIGYSFSDISGEKTENSRGLHDTWAVKLDGNGIVEWDKTIGGSGDDFAGREAVIEIAPDRYLIGTTSPSDISGDKTKPSKGDFDYWLTEVRYNTITAGNGVTSKVFAAPVTEDAIAAFSVSPNPATNVLHVQVSKPSFISLTNESGKLLYEKIISGRGDINVSQLPAGIYYLKNTTTGVIQKVMIAR